MGPDLLRVFGERGAPLLDGCGRSGFPFEHDLTGGQPRSVEPLVCVHILTNRAAVDGDTSEQSSRARVAENLRPQLDVRGRLRVAPDRPGGDGRIRSNLELVADEVLEAALIVDDQDDVG